MYLILHNIRSAYNVGAIFRTADGAGVKKIFLTGYTPSPTDRFGRTQNEIDKTSLGASQTVPWEQVDIVDIIAALKTDRVTVVAAEQTPASIVISDFVVPEQVAYIFGNEVDGVPTDVLDRADMAVAIPMRGQKESLN